jgi:hypothetical protein
MKQGIWQWMFLIVLLMGLSSCAEMHQRYQAELLRQQQLQPVNCVGWQMGKVSNVQCR